MDSRTSSPPPDVHPASKLICATIPFYLIALILFTTRITVQIRKSRFGLDDYFLAAGMITASGYYVIYFLSISNGLGRHAMYLSMHQLSLQAFCSLYIAEFYVWTVTFVKVSLALMLLRVPSHRAQHIFIRCLIVFVLVLALVACAMDYTICRPIRALWDFSFERSHCISMVLYRDWIYIASSLFLATDLILSLLPIALLLNLAIPVRQKFLIGTLMGLGILAVCAIIPKLIVLRNLGTNSDVSYDSGDVYLFCFLEMCLGIITTCLPPLKTGAEAWLRKMGVVSTHITKWVGNEKTAGSSQDSDEMEMELKRQRVQSCASTAGTFETIHVGVPYEAV